LPEPGLIGFIEFCGRSISRRWKAVRNKRLVLGILLAVISVTLPIMLLTSYYCCQPDPFAHLKAE
jgi:hypothetical protein